MIQCWLKKIFTIVVCINIYLLDGRSVHRTADPLTPTITAQWLGGEKKYTRTDSHYEEYPIFGTFDQHFFYNHLLPQYMISYYENGIKTGAQGIHFYNIMENMLVELENGKKNFTDFIVLQHKNFNYKLRCGLLVLKFKQYPFVVKLFIETPKTFVNPHCKGFEPTFFFYMSGGSNRHVAGFTRIKNREYIKQWAHHNEQWQGKIRLPRKWFWKPRKCQFLEITGTNIGNKKTVHTCIPSTYAVIADYVDTNKSYSIQNKSDLIMQLCNDLNLFVDPHMNNFVIQHNHQTDTNIITIIDTEHFPTIVGFKEKIHFDSHISWIWHLTSKCFDDAYLRPKSRRIAAQYQNPLQYPFLIL